MTQKITIEQTNFADGWIPVVGSWSYASADSPTFTITVPSGAASLYSPEMRIKLTQTTVKYFIVTAVADSVLTVYGGTDYTLVNAAISAISYSTQKAPLGFPLDSSKWMQQFSSTSYATQASPSANVWYNLASASLSIPIGCWDIEYFCSIGMNVAGANAAFDIKSSLSTANNSQGDSDLTAAFTGFSTAAQYLGHNLTKRKIINLSSKTTYHLNHSVGQSISGTMNLAGSVGKTIIRAVCAYL